MSRPGTRHRSSAHDDPLAARSFAQLFEPARVGVGETTWQEPLTELTPEEAIAVRNAVPKRRLEFRAGREAARRALAGVGGPAGPIISADDRSPIWPAGYVGSITHTGDVERGWAGAAVARAADVVSIGLDAESDQPLELALWRLVLSRAERAMLSRFDAATAGRIAKLMFSTKECVYKLQYPITGRFLGFEDLEIDIDLDHGRFSATFCRVVGQTFGAGDSVTGRFCSAGGLWLTGAFLLPAG